MYKILIKNNPINILIGLFLFFFFTWNFGFRQGFLWLIGIGFGIFLNLSKFGFTTGWRVFIEQKNVKGINAQLLLILVLTILSLILFKQFSYFQSASAPITISLLIGSFVFGAFMQLADGCGSGTLYKSGNIQTYNLLILPAFILGAFVATFNLEDWINIGILLPPTNLLQLFNWWQYLLVQLSLLALFYFLFNSNANRDAKQPINWQGNTIFYSSLIIAILAFLNLLVAGQPWGIVYGLGLWGAKVFTAFTGNLADVGYWQDPYNNFALEHSVLFDNTSMTNIGILFGAFCIRNFSNKNYKSLDATQFIISFNKTNLFKIIRIIIIGFILGYSSRIAFGCNIGAYVSGISTGSLHGWVWFIFAFFGSYCVIKLKNLIK